MKSKNTAVKEINGHHHERKLQAHVWTEEHPEAVTVFGFDEMSHLRLINDNQRIKVRC